MGREYQIDLEDEAHRLRVELAKTEAERNVMRELLQIVWNGFLADPEDTALTAEQIKRICAALAPSPAGREG